MQKNEINTKILIRKLTPKWERGKWKHQIKANKKEGQSKIKPRLYIKEHVQKKKTSNQQHGREIKKTRKQRKVPFFLRKKCLQEKKSPKPEPRPKQFPISSQLIAFPETNPSLFELTKWSLFCWENSKNRRAPRPTHNTRALPRFNRMISLCNSVFGCF